ncbi:hypothetical protein Acr_25g0001610 [Actinidia rufa]|uniref:Uncharacterized protein n=1 Tax=Actinidia rufa TaxID=165716 RepID=A0A7J0GY72_9ERIC|nr:hypothetical protein Acr_25g0001610 [Actinidia rufa]
MALNRAQLLVHDDEVLAQFRVDHRIPDSVVIEQPDSNDDADWVEGEGQWEFPANDSNLYSVPRHRGYVPVGFNARFWRRRSDRCSDAISAVNNCRRSCKVYDLLGYAPMPRSSLSDEVSDLFEGASTKLRRLLKEAKGESSDSSESSSSSWDVDLGNEGEGEEAEVEDGEKVDQVPAAAPLVPVPIAIPPVEPQDVEPIIAPSLDSDHAEDIAIVKPKEVVEHSYDNSNSSSSNSMVNEEAMAPKVRILGKGQAARDDSSKHPEFTAVELGKYATFADTSKDHETCVPLGNAVMLSQDVADHADETPVEFGGKLVMLGAQSSCLPASPEQYSPIVLPDFNEEEYATLPADEGDVNTVVVGARAGVEKTIVEGAEGDRDGEVEGKTFFRGRAPPSGCSGLGSKFSWRTSLLPTPVSDSHWTRHVSNLYSLLGRVRFAKRHGPGSRSHVSVDSAALQIFGLFILFSTCLLPRPYGYPLDDCRLTHLEATIHKA